MENVNFTDEQKIAIGDMIKDALQDKVPAFNTPNSDQWRKDARHLSSMDRIWRQNGRVGDTGERVEMRDLFKKDFEITAKMRDNFSTDHPLLIPRVVSNMAREAIEPNLVLTPLMQRMSYTAGTQIVFPAWGAMHAADIAEGEEYPERSMELAGEVVATIGKSGIAIKVTEETLRYSQFDVLSMHVRAAGRALARHKERKVANLILNNATLVLDNTSTDAKSTTGRDASGSRNGTLTLDDLFYAHATMVNTGFTPNTLIMHPFAWKIFAQEGIARAFGFQNGMGSALWQMPQGGAGSAEGWRVGGLNQNTFVSDPGNIASTFTNVPSLFPTMYNIIVTPYMPYYSSTNTTDIILCDRSELGILIVDEEVTTDQWTDVARDIEKIKFRERYGLAIQNEGKGIGKLKGISLDRSYDFSDKLNVSVTPSDPLSGDPDYSGIIS